MDYKELTKNSYDKNPEGFAERFQNFSDKQEPEMLKFIETLGGKNILELGCGAGYQAKYFMDKGLNVKAIDISEGMVNIAKSRGVDAEVMDIEDLKFEDKSFDGIWAVTSLLHIDRDKIPKVVEKISNLLKENGILYVCLKEGEGEKLMNDEEGDRYFVYWQKEEFLEVMKEHYTLLDFTSKDFKGTIFMEFLFKKN